MRKKEPLMQLLFSGLKTNIIHGHLCKTSARYPSSSLYGIHLPSAFTG